MRKASQLSLMALSLAASVVACGREKSTVQQDDFKNDLQLAASSSMDLATPKVDPSLLDASLETKPQGAPQAASTVKKASSGNRAVHSNNRSVRAAPETQTASTESSQETETVQQAPAPDISEPAAVAPRPTAVPTTGAGDGSGDYGTSGNGGGIFGPGGGMGGVVIFGGGADGDHCEPYPSGRYPRGGAIYIPRSPVPSNTGVGAGIPRSGGMTTRRPGTGGSRAGSGSSRTGSGSSRAGIGGSRRRG